jgi:L-arabinokinase
VAGRIEQRLRLADAPATTTADTFPDADAFCGLVAESAFFSGDGPVFVARAPGRLDVLGGIADYSGSLALELPLQAAALAAAQLHDDGSAVVVSGNRRAALDVGDLTDLTLPELATRFADSAAWAAYVLGPIALLVREERTPLGGLRVLLSSDVPEAKGLASSAAIGVAALEAVAACLGCEPELRRFALLSQRAEQLFAGAPCGSMDQMTAAYGEQGHLLLLLCRPAEIVRLIPVPRPLAVWGIDSGVLHAVAGSAYREARCAAFIGKAMLGCTDEYLTVLDPSEVDPEQLPERLAGADFLRRHGRIEDPACTVEPDVVYPVRAATVFPLEEQIRVRAFAELLAPPVTGDRARLLGELMYESHAGYSRCGLGTTVTDELVEAVRRAGWERGLAGARASAGGSGGTVVVLGRADAEPLVRTIAAELGAGVVVGSSSGAASFGVRTLPGKRSSR